MHSAGLELAKMISAVYFAAYLLDHRGRRNGTCLPECGCRYPGITLKATFRESIALWHGTVIVTARTLAKRSTMKKSGTNNQIVRKKK